MLNSSFIKYGIVGIVSVIIDYSILFLMYSLLDFDKNISITVGFFGSSIFNFLMHKKFTFLSKNDIKLEVVKYLIMVSISYLLTIIIINILLKFTNLYISKLISLIFIYLYGYLMSKFFVYKGYNEY